MLDENDNQHINKANDTIGQTCDVKNVLSVDIITLWNRVVKFIIVTLGHYEYLGLPFESLHSLSETIQSHGFVKAEFCEHCVQV